MRVRYLTLEQMLHVADIAAGGSALVRDLGLLDSAVHRPQAAFYGREAYPDLLTKAAALLDSVVRNHPLVDGNKRAGWLATYTFCALNGVRPEANEDDAFDLVIAVASGVLTEVPEIALRLAGVVAED